MMAMPPYRTQSPRCGTSGRRARVACARGQAPGANPLCARLSRHAPAASQVVWLPDAADSAARSLRLSTDLLAFDRSAQRFVDERRLLRVCRQRQSRRTAENGDEFTPPHRTIPRIEFAEAWVGPGLTPMKPRI